MQHDTVSYGLHVAWSRRGRFAGLLIALYGPPHGVSMPALAAVHRPARH